MSQHTISALLLERYHLGEVSQAEKNRVETALRTDAALQKQLQELQQSEHEILEKYPVSTMAHQIKETLRTRELQAQSPERDTTPRLGKWIKSLGIAMPVLAATLIFFLVLPSPEREKGLEPGLILYQKTDLSIQPVSPGAVLEENAVLQIAYRAAGFEYGIILSIDGNGTITVHHPPDRMGSSRIEPRNEHPLPRSYQLDDAPYFEKFFLITSRYPVPMGRVLKAAQELAEQGVSVSNSLLNLPPYLEQSSFLIQKKER